MKKLFFLLALTFIAILSGKAQQILYSWQSPTGTVEEFGGKLEHINLNGNNLRNVKCGNYHAFVLNGDYMYVYDSYQADECSYMRLTLDNGNVFHEGDEIEVTAMRNNTADRPASIYFLFRTTKKDSVSGTVSTADIPLIDTNVWNNLGEAKDGSFNGGTSAQSNSFGNQARAAFEPSTYTFTVPAEADGATSLRITRYQTGNLLYVTRLVVRQTEYSAVRLPATTPCTATTTKKFFKDGRLVISHNGRLYDASGAITDRQ